MSWVLRKPKGNDPQVVANIAGAIGQTGQYAVDDAGPDWIIRRIAPPPKLIEPMSLKVTSAGVLAGSLFELTSRAAPWVAQGRSLGALPDPNAINRLEGRGLPQNALEWADAQQEARTALMSATPETIPQITVRVANALLAWCPLGQMGVWAKNFDYMKEERVVHILATAHLFGLDAAAEVIASGSSMLIAAEDILTAHPGVIYHDLVDAGTSGWVFETIPFTFTFDFGEYREWAALDRAAIERLHSLTLATYTARLPALSRTVLNLGVFGQPALREWFLSRYNDLAVRLIRLESFRTDAGRLRPIIQNQVMMTVARILNATAHGFAAGEFYTRLADFWDLVDLYAGLRNKNSVAELFTAAFWNRQVLVALGTLPGGLAPALRSHARRSYLNWVADCVEGITQPSRKGRLIAIGDGSGQRQISPSSYFAHHMATRRNTLHGYYPRRIDDYRDYVATHDGHLPENLSDWPRWLILTLLARQTFFFDDYLYLSPSGDGRTG